MTPVHAEKTQSLRDSQPKTDYERWLEERDENDQAVEDSEYHPTIPGINGQILLLHHPSGRFHLKESDTKVLQSHQRHGEFLHRRNIRSFFLPEDAIAQIPHEPCVWGLVLLFAVIIICVHAGQSLSKQRGRVRASSSPISNDPLVLDIDKKYLV
ncbi:hypothetical protein BDV26DRAFT_208156 [Aspergillus bertholletiae]|uniref:Uncharacterized protein n=1 Tax=Aspergillus bertholletiae TaxID=1226010 RepID=A0A5N7B6A6_9EURO|nr:hypothetical protein BDV26DRAFT_208156 [Aspergillus bertholletiae]